MVNAQIVVNSMHERKVEMAQRASAFVGLPGGFGTLEEVSCSMSAAVQFPKAFHKVLEVTTWNQIGMHNKRERPPPAMLSHH